MQLSRRRFLGLGLATGAVTLLVGLPPALGRRPDAGGQGPARVLDALTDAIFQDPDAVGLPRAREVDAGARTWRVVQGLPRPARVQALGLVRGLEYGAVALAGRRFTRLSEAEQRALVARLALVRGRAPRRALAELKGLCALGLLTHPRAWAAMGYSGPTSVEGHR